MRPLLVLSCLVFVLSTQPCLIDGAQTADSTPTSALPSASSLPSVTATQPIAPAVSQIIKIQDDKTKLSPVARKVGAQLAAAANAVSNANLRPAGVTSALAASAMRLVLIKADVNADLLGLIRNRGTVYGFDDSTISARIPTSLIWPLAGRKDVYIIDDAPRASTQATFTDEGDAAHDAAAAREEFNGTDGTGVRIGIISDSASNDALEYAFSNDDLDQATTHVVHGQSGFDGTDEGVAMMELIRSIAPGAELFFATGDPPAGELGMKANIETLWKDYHCKIIVDDVSFSDESPFQDGIVGQAVADASNSGVLFFSAATNSGNRRSGTSSTWEGQFRAADATLPQAAGEPLVFGKDNAGEPLLFNEIVGIDPQHNHIDLFWPDKWGAATNGYNLYVLDGATKKLLAVANSNTGNPYQSCCSLDVNGNNYSPRVGDLIVITKDPKSKDLYLHLDVDRDRLAVFTGGVTRGHNASGAENAFSVAAINARGRETAFLGGPGEEVESYSSDGPRLMFLNRDGSPLRPDGTGETFQKPDIAAADCVETSLSQLSPFCGTSAAAPHAAAIAALIWSRHPDFTASLVKRALIRSALPIEGSSPNSDAGFGVVMASAALRISDTISTESQAAASTGTPSPAASP